MALPVPMSASSAHLSVNLGDGKPPALAEMSARSGTGATAATLAETTLEITLPPISAGAAAPVGVTTPAPVQGGTASPRASPRQSPSHRHQRDVRVSLHDIGELPDDAWDPTQELLQFTARRGPHDASRFVAIADQLLNNSLAAIGEADDGQTALREFQERVDETILNVWSRSDERVRAQQARNNASKNRQKRGRQRLEDKQRRQSYVNHLAQDSHQVMWNPAAAKGGEKGEKGGDAGGGGEARFSLREQIPASRLMR